LETFENLRVINNAKPGLFIRILAYGNMPFIKL
jgi:hypothetical protein